MKLWPEDRSISKGNRVFGIFPQIQHFETDNAGDALFSEIAMDASGNAITVWQQHDGGRDNIWANQFN